MGSESVMIPWSEKPTITTAELLWTRCKHEDPRRGGLKKRLRIPQRMKPTANGVCKWDAK